jgi:hypothetical protein
MSISRSGGIMDSIDSAICDFTQYKQRYFAIGRDWLLSYNFNSLSTVFLHNVTSPYQKRLSLNNLSLYQIFFESPKAVSDIQEHNRWLRYERCLNFRPGGHSRQLLLPGLMCKRWKNRVYGRMNITVASFYTGRHLFPQQKTVSVDEARLASSAANRASRLTKILNYKFSATKIAEVRSEYTFI